MSNRDPDAMRTLLLGLDGVAWSVLDPLVDEGRLPNLAALFERGVTADLESQIPPWTPSAWPSLFTGVNPGKHGVFDFLAFDGYDWRIVDRTDVDEYAVWELLDQRDLASVVVNVPVTGPPRPFDGALVPGYVAPEDPPCHPDGLLDELREELGDYRVYAPEGVDGDEQVEWYRRLVEMRGEAFRYLVARHDPEFGFLQFQQTDTVFHERPDDREAVTAVFEAVDEQVGRVLDACNPDAVFVVSDHGIGPYDGYEFRANEFLRERDLLETTQGAGGMPSWTSLARDRDGDGSGPGLGARLAQAAASVGVTSQRINAVLSRLHLDGLVLRFVSTDTVRAATERVDFPSSTAYMRSRTELGVRINKAGRDPEGVVSPAEYASVRRDIVRELQEATTPDGDPVFEEVAPAEAYFEGPHADDAVDVVTVPAAFDNYLSASLRGSVFGDPSEPWNHKLTGVFAAAGDGVEDAAPDAHLFDVAPTLLSSLDVPPSTRMDGETLPVVSAVRPEEYGPFTARATDHADDDGVKRRLSNLGYLDDDR